MKIEILFPEVCNLYGDLQNVYYLARCCRELEIVETDLHSRPCFLSGEIALVYMGSTTEAGLRLAADALRPYVSAIRERINAGQHILLTGNALDLFTARIESDMADTVEGLGLLPGHVRYTMLRRHNSFFLGSFEEMNIVGFKSLFGFVYDAAEQDALFVGKRGIGRNPDTPAEGFRLKNLLATHLIGPLLILNPPFTKYLLRELGCDDTLAFEDAAMDSYLCRVAEFEDEKRSWKY